MRYIRSDLGDGFGTQRFRVLAIFPLREDGIEVRASWLLTPWGGVFAELEYAQAEEYAVVRERVQDSDPRSLAVRFIVGSLQLLAVGMGLEELKKKIFAGDVWVDWEYLGLSPELSELGQGVQSG